MITIEIDVSDNFANDLIQDGAKIDVTNTLQALHDETSFSYGIVDIHGRLPLIDRYGNREIGNVIELRYRKTALDRINWARFQWTNVYDIAECIWMHPAFEQ